MVIDGSSYGQEVTVRHLLTHCSGVPSLNDPDFLDRLNNEPGRVWTPWDKIEASLLEPPTGRPGEVVVYSDTGYVLLAMVLEKASGLPLAALYRETLRFGALGMRTLYLEKLEPVRAGSGPRLRHYVNGMDASDLDATCDLWGGGGLVCDARDLAEFWRALFGGRVYDRPETLAEMCVTRPWPSAGWHSGMGVIRGQVCGGEVWWHTGAWGSFAVWDPRTGVTFAGMMTERSPGPRRPPRAIRRAARRTQLGRPFVHRSVAFVFAVVACTQRGPPAALCSRPGRQKRVCRRCLRQGAATPGSRPAGPGSPRIHHRADLGCQGAGRPPASVRPAGRRRAGVDQAGHAGTKPARPACSRQPERQSRLAVAPAKRAV